MHNLSCIWMEQGRFHEAIGLMERCCRLRTRVLGSEHPDTQKSLSELQNWRNEAGISEGTEYSDTQEQSSDAQDWHAEGSQASNKRQKRPLKTISFSIRIKIRNVIHRHDRKGG
ncbi:hypothetical protein RRF57_005036 [Xylaria bambusicola]|uniref:Kinesin light chain n=1 Tax=Xylaria bambusicola TaxID=326684 RepID=A0AAN7UPT6_9PEZI